MAWLDYLAYFFGGVFLTNVVPHFVNGVSGRSFPSPFARPPGVGLSSPVVNVAWALANLVIAYLLVCRVGAFDLRDTGDAIAFGLGVAIFALLIAQRFGRLNGSSKP
jgi:hypothetical protein